MATTHTNTMLANGMRLVLVPSDHATSVMVRVTARVGSRHETDDVAGTAHFFEHMLFKGTHRRPKAMDINREITVRGADSNAFTSQDQTEFYVRASAAELPWAMDLLHDMVSDPLFDPEELERERKVVLEEHASDKDDPSCIVEERTYAHLFAGSTLARPILGHRRTIKNLSRATLVEFHVAHYRPTNLILTISGGFDPDAALTLANETFGRMVATHPPLLGPKGFRDAPAQPCFATSAKEFSQTHITLSFRSLAFGEPGRAARAILGAILGGSECSRLWQQIREERGWAYSIGVSEDIFSDTGCLEIAAELNAEHSVEAVGLMARECVRLAAEPVSEDELHQVKSMIRGQHALAYESPHDQAAHFISQLFYGVPEETLSEHIERLMAVTSEEVRAAAQTIFHPHRMAFAAAGATRRSQQYRKAILESFI